MMKYFILLLTPFIFLNCMGSNTEVNSDQTAQDYIITDTANKRAMAFIEFCQSTESFGTINKSKNPNAEVLFSFKNTGEMPLVLSKVDVSCNCISIEFPKTPILSKGEGVIKAKINAANQYGVLIKQIIVKSNAQNEYVLLKVTGNIQ